jgi:NosR/NirI family transcriptional regulator, nitrous oxide reductase regulator
VRKLVAAALFLGVVCWCPPQTRLRLAAGCTGLTGSGQPRFAVLDGLGLVLCAQQTVTPPAADKWQFADDDEQTPGWREVVGAQAVDLVGFGAFTALALVSFFRKSVRLKYVTLGIAVVYLGFMKSQLISIVNVFSLIDWNLPILRYSLAWYLLAVFTVLSTVLWGRLYCGRMCAFGALTQLMDTIVPDRWRRELPAKLDRHAATVKYVVLGCAIVYFVVTHDRSIYRYIEPFWMFGFHGTALTWIGLGILLTATIFVRNLYCRYLCPVGAALGILSRLTVFRIKRWSECKTCKICEKTCQWGAIRGPEIVLTECVRCDDCERLYMDQQKCPHWIIILKKQGGRLVPAGRAATPAH